MGARLSGLGSALWDSKRKQFLGRDGAGWGKLGVFYFFFYLGLAGFFCAMLAIFMALTPRDHPRYFMEESRMRTRSNPLAPGLGFRPQPDPDRSLIYVDKTAAVNSSYVKHLDQYLKVYYWQNDRNEGRDNNEPYSSNNVDGPSRPYQKFVISQPGECTSAYQYGFKTGRPCVLIKMNKIVDFKPTPGATHQDKDGYKAACTHRTNAVAVHCYGEYPADVDNIGQINYRSENGFDSRCGSLDISRFPYLGKENRKDYYQAPYVWVQFTNPKPNVLINVLCRVYAQNVDFDKKAGRGLTRFQIYVDGTTGSSRRQSGEL